MWKQSAFNRNVILIFIIQPKITDLYVNKSRKLFYAMWQFFL